MPALSYLLQVYMHPDSRWLRERGAPEENPGLKFASLQGVRELAIVPEANACSGKALDPHGP